MFKIKCDTDKFENLNEFCDFHSRGGEVEFSFNKKKYSITHPKGLISFIEHGNESSLKYFKNIEELLSHKIDGCEIRSIVTQIQPFFRCF